MQYDHGKIMDWQDIAARLTAELAEFDGASVDEPTSEGIKELRQETLAQFLQSEFGRENAN